MYTAEEGVWFSDKLTIFSTEEAVSTFSIPSGWETCWTRTIYSEW